MSRIRVIDGIDQQPPYGLLVVPLLVLVLVLNTAVFEASAESVACTAVLNVE